MGLIWEDPPKRRSPADSGNKEPWCECKCSYGRAADALRRGKVRLAVRFIRMDIKSRMGVLS